MCMQWPVLLCFTLVTMAEENQTTVGTCEGPNAMYVKLISSDNHEFIVKREHALTSGTIKAMLSGPGITLDFLFYHLQLTFFFLLKEHSLNMKQI